MYLPEDLPRLLEALRATSGLRAAKRIRIAPEVRRESKVHWPSKLRVRRSQIRALKKLPRGFQAPRAPEELRGDLQVPGDESFRIFRGLQVPRSGKHPEVLPLYAQSVLLRAWLLLRSWRYWLSRTKYARALVLPLYFRFHGSAFLLHGSSINW